MSAAGACFLPAGMSSARLALPALMLGALGIGFSPIFMRLSELGPTGSAFHRVFLALPLIWGWRFLEKNLPEPSPGPARARDYWLLVLSGFFFAGDLAFWHWSVAYTSVANATLLANFAPIFVTLAAFFLFKERFSKLFIAALVIASCGAIILLGSSLSIGKSQLFGDVLGIITAVFYAAYIITVSRLRSRFSVAVFMAWGTLFTAIFLLPVVIISGENLIPATLNGWLVLLGLAWFSHTGGQGMISYALAHLSAAFSSLALLVQPAIAAFAAWAILGEAMSINQLFGAGVILSGIYIARRASL